MSTIYEAAIEFKKLMDYEYKFVIGIRGKNINIPLRFDTYSFHHLCGLHKLTDIFPHYENRADIFNSILNKSITDNDLSKSSFYFKEGVDDRINLVAKLSSILEHNINETQIRKTLV